MLSPMYIRVPYSKTTDIKEQMLTCGYKNTETCFAILNCGIYENQVYPISALYIYSTTAKTKAL